MCSTIDYSKCCVRTAIRNLAFAFIHRSSLLTVRASTDFDTFRFYENLENECINLAISIDRIGKKVRKTLG